MMHTSRERCLWCGAVGFFRTFCSEECHRKYIVNK